MFKDSRTRSFLNLRPTAEILLDMGREIYILHGWAIDFENEKKWTIFREGLESLGFKTFFLGLPGLSTALSQVWKLDDYVGWLESQLINKDNVILLGHSFGGQIAIRYAAKHKKQVSKLVLIDSAGIIDKSANKVIKRLIFGIISKLGKKVFKHELFRIFLYKLAREKDYLEADEVQRQIMANVISEEIIFDLSKIICPTKIIWGQKDTTTPIFIGKKMSELIVGSTISIIDDAKHSPHFTHTDETISILKDFLK